MSKWTKALIAVDVALVGYFAYKNATAKERPWSKKKPLKAGTVVDLPPPSPGPVELNLPPYPLPPPEPACLLLTDTGSDMKTVFANLRNGITFPQGQDGIWVSTQNWNFSPFYLAGKKPSTAGGAIRLSDPFKILAWRAYSNYQPTGSKYWAFLARDASVAQVPWLNPFIGRGANNDTARQAAADVGDMLGHFIKLQWAKLVKDLFTKPFDWVADAKQRREAAAELAQATNRVWRSWIYNHPNNTHLRTLTDKGNPTLELDPIFANPFASGYSCGEDQQRVGAGGVSPVVFIPKPPVG